LVSLISYPKRKLRKMAKNGDYKEALEFGHSIEEKFSEDADFLFIMGSIYYILEDAENALHYFDRSLNEGDPDTETLFLKANVHFALKENDTVRECCEEILKMNPDHNDAKDLLAHMDQN